MSFYLSALPARLVLPSSILAVLLIFGLLLIWFRPRQRAGLMLASAAMFGIAFCGLAPVGNWLLLPLENRFPPLTASNLPKQVTGLILLGGFESGWVNERRPGLALNEAAERVTEGLRLASRYPSAKVIFTGGVAELVPSHAGAAGPVGQFLKDMGLDETRILLEPKARNTYENATYTKALLKPQAGQTWVLVTSAYHMPRAIGVFRRQGFDVIAAPVDYRTRGQDDLWRGFGSIPAGLKRTDTSVREWLGLLGYWLTGRTENLFPKN